MIYEEEGWQTHPWPVFSFLLSFEFPIQIGSMFPKTRRATDISITLFSFILLIWIYRFRVSPSFHHMGGEAYVHDPSFPFRFCISKFRKHLHFSKKRRATDPEFSLLLLKLQAAEWVKPHIAICCKRERRWRKLLEQCSFCSAILTDNERLFFSLGQVFCRVQDSWSGIPALDCITPFC